MSHNHLQLWHHTTARRELDDSRVLRHSGSDQFCRTRWRVRPGDTLWVVTVYPPGGLFLLGRLLVGECTDHEGARQCLDYEPYEADYHVIARPGTEEPLRQVNLMAVARELRFVSRVNDRLDLADGLVDAQQLQTMRRLTPDSAELLEQRWSASDPGKAPIDRFTWNEGDVIITYDPSKDPNAKTGDQIRAERRARGEIVESDYRDAGASREARRSSPGTDELMRFRRRRGTRS